MIEKIWLKFLTVFWWRDTYYIDPKIAKGFFYMIQARRDGVIRTEIFKVENLFRTRELRTEIYNYTERLTIEEFVGVAHAEAQAYIRATAESMMKGAVRHKQMLKLVKDESWAMVEKLKH